MKLHDDLLRLDLQYFGGDDKEEPTEPQTDPQIDPKEPSEPNNSTAGEPGTNPEDKTFTQEDIDRIVKERLDREKRKRDEAIEQERQKAEEQRLKEQGEYKELYEQLQTQLEEQKASVTQAKKESALVQAGYAAEKIPKLLKLVEGEEDDDIQASIEELKEIVPVEEKKPSYADPSLMNGKRQQPKQVGGEEKGREVARRLLAKRKPKK